MSKITTLHLGGEDRIIDVGKMWFTKYYGEALGSDPLASTNQTGFDFAVNLIWAGIQAAGGENGNALTKAEVINLVGDADQETITDFTNWFTEVSTPKSQGEAKAQAVNG